MALGKRRRLTKDKILGCAAGQLDRRRRHPEKTVIPRINLAIILKRRSLNSLLLCTNHDMPTPCDPPCDPCLGETSWECDGGWIVRGIIVIVIFLIISSIQKCRKKKKIKRDLASGAGEGSRCKGVILGILICMFSPSGLFRPVCSSKTLNSLPSTVR